MVFSSSTILLSTPIAGWRLPVLGLLLTGLGLILLYAGVGDLNSPARPFSSTASSMVAAVEMPDPVDSVALSAGTAWSGAGVAVRAASGRSRGRADCLGANPAKGRRAESAHLATVTLLRPAECGDLRDVIKVMATLPRTSHTDNADSQQIGLPFPVAEDPHEYEGIDVLEATLYGPPDRQPQATLEEKMRGHGRGRARDYLEDTAARGVLAP